MKPLLNFIFLCSILLTTACTNENEPQKPSSLDNPLELQIPNSALVTPDEVENVINTFCSDTSIFTDHQKYQSRNSSSPIVNKLVDNETPIAFIVNFPNDNGFVIVGATKNFFPVLAYSQTGNFNLNAGKDTGLMDWIDDLKTLTLQQCALPEDSLIIYRRIWQKYEKKNPVSRSLSVRKGTPQYNFDYERLISEFQDSVMAWHSRPNFEIIPIGEALTGDQERDADLWASVPDGHVWPEYEEIWQDITIGLKTIVEDYYKESHTISTHWDQIDPYNKSFNTIYTDDGKPMTAYAGCMTIALGQLMNYYKHPSKYEWSKFEGNVDYNELSNFLYDIAREGHATMKPTGTTITIPNALTVLKNFGYNVAKYDHIENSGMKLPYIVISDFFNTKTNTKSAHAWLVTGTRTVYYVYNAQIWTFTEPYKFREWWSESIRVSAPTIYEINWGWGGVNDGFYSYLPPYIPDHSNHTIRAAIVATPK